MLSIKTFLYKYKVLILVMLIGLSLDLFSKWHVFENILGITSEDIHRAVEISPDNPGKYLNNARIEISENRLYFSSVLNPGAFSGFLSGNMTFLVILSTIAIIFLFWLFFKATDLTIKMQFLAGLIFAGALGNMYDRIVFSCVRDFVEFRVPELGFKFLDPWNVFNLADTFISVGVFTFVAMMIFTGTKKIKHKKSDETQELDNLELEKIEDETDSKIDEPQQDELKTSENQYFVVFNDCKEHNVDEFVQPFAQLLNMHLIDSKRILKKQQCFINYQMSMQDAEATKILLETKISDVKIVDASEFPRISRIKEVFYLSPTEEGLIIGSELAKGEKPINWDEILFLTIAFIPGTDDPVLKTIKEKLEKSAILDIEGISKEEKSKIYADMLGSIDKKALWQDALDSWFKLMDSEDLKTKKNEFPQLIADIFLKSGEHYRINSKNLIFSTLNEKRTPNELHNTRLVLWLISQKLTDAQTSETLKSLVNKENNEFHSEVTENMFFEYIPDFENYLRWFFWKTKLGSKSELTS